MDSLRLRERFFNQPVESRMVLLNSKKTRKVRRVKKGKRVLVPRKTLSKVESDLEVAYRKYVNSVKSKKTCRVKSFRTFAKEHITGLKKRRSAKKSKKVDMGTVPSIDEATATEIGRAHV